MTSWDFSPSDSWADFVEEAERSEPLSAVSKAPVPAASQEQRPSPSDTSVTMRGGNDRGRGRGARGARGDRGGTARGSRGGRGAIASPASMPPPFTPTSFDRSARGRGRGRGRGALSGGWRSPAAADSPSSSARGRADRGSPSSRPPKNGGFGAGSPAIAPPPTLRFADELTRVTNAAAIDAERLDLLLVDVPANAPLEIFFHSLLQSAELPEKLVIVLAMSGDFDIGHCKDCKVKWRREQMVSVGPRRVLLPLHRCGPENVTAIDALRKVADALFKKQKAASRPGSNGASTTNRVFVMGSHLKPLVDEFIAQGRVASLINTLDLRTLQDIGSMLMGIAAYRTSGSSSTSTPTSSATEEDLATVLVRVEDWLSEKKSNQTALTELRTSQKILNSSGSLPKSKASLEKTIVPLCKIQRNLDAEPIIKELIGRAFIFPCSNCDCIKVAPSNIRAESLAKATLIRGPHKLDEEVSKVIAFLNRADKERLPRTKAALARQISSFRITVQVDPRVVVAKLLESGVISQVAAEKEEESDNSSTSSSFSWRSSSPSDAEVLAYHV